MLELVDLCDDGSGVDFFWRSSDLILGHFAQGLNNNFLPVVRCVHSLKTENCEALK